MGGSGAGDLWCHVFGWSVTGMRTHACVCACVCARVVFARASVKRGKN